MGCCGSTEEEPGIEGEPVSFADVKAAISEEEDSPLGSEQVIEQAFKVFDLDKDGQLGYDDLCGILTRQEWDKPAFEPLLGPDEVTEVLATYGSDGYLSLEQFTTASQELSTKEAAALKKRMAQVAMRRAKLAAMGANTPVITAASVVSAEESAAAPSHCHLLIVTLDYAGGSVGSTTGGELTSSSDARRMIALAEAAGCADVVVVTDVDGLGEAGHPSAYNVSEQFAQMGSRCEPGDTFVLYYAGHGTNLQDCEAGDEKDGYDEALVCTTPDGSYDCLRDDQICELIDALPEGVKVLTMIDACHSGTPTDVDTHDYGERHVMNLSASADSQFANSTGDGGMFTSAILEVLATRAEEMNAGVPVTPPTVIDVYNWTLGRFGFKFGMSDQSMMVGKTKNTDAAAFAWPLMPAADSAFEPDTRMKGPPRGARPQSTEEYENAMKYYGGHELKAATSGGLQFTSGGLMAFVVDES
jgi:hypothetical protein